MEDIRCPRCGSTEVIEIIYGFPSEDEMRRAEDGDVVLAGCFFSLYKPDRHYYCIDCDFKF